MKAKITILFALVIIPVMLTSCITSHDYKDEISCDEFRDNNHRIAEFEVEVGDKIRVELCSNPTTGFEWTCEISDEAVLQKEDYDFIEPENENVVGASGTDIWTFEAAKKGTAEVDMEYSQTWAGGTKGEWTYTMKVTVK